MTDKPTRRNETITDELMAKMPVHKDGRVITGQVQKSEYDAKKKTYVTKTYNFYEDGTEECLNEAGKKVEW